MIQLDYGSKVEDMDDHELMGEHATEFENVGALQGEVVGEG